MSKSESNVISVAQKGQTLTVQVKVPSVRYLEQIMRCNCFPELHDLFKHAHSPAKEFTESYAALVHLRKTIDKYPEGVECIHVGDGAHARTGALFSFLTKNTYNYSVDPITNNVLVESWWKRFSVRGFFWIPERIESIVWPNFMINRARVVTFVHAHVNVDEVLSNIPGWSVAYINPCCFPSQQLSQKYTVLDHGYDWDILSEKREYQVICNKPLR